ncbi:MAG: Glycosyl hydrolase family 57 [bacterium]|nr:MAG: Glycosyl hydrolase family 57 [bacterium]KAF0149802.1 MAG: Glycosyl hydrolase family 57 [bacterium]KAF0168503.1 MAG: Glycosyl hydrolase family 57 [bacterium]TXT19564.1 MAG: Glycosyl hydrolase family 57 [bacterium]
MAWLLLAPPLVWVALILIFLRPLRAAWREPTLRHPVLIVESDDWGPGPARHATALHRLAKCLLKYRDANGRLPVMTLGLTLSLPDSQAIRAAGLSLPYHSLPLTAPVYADILAAIREGIAAGIFAPQLHGMAHYWPEALMRAGQADPQVLDWILAGPGQETESLPSPLQSRWVDASVLPSRTLPEPEIRAAVAEEIALYTQIFGDSPAVVVPPTFVWTETVEAAWARGGVACVVTPGRRYIGRDAAGKPTAGAMGVALRNGQTGAAGVLYLVRDDYFEPAYGHAAERALDALRDKTAQGRPCLLETHRFNFTGEHAAAALRELDRLFAEALSRHTDLRFTSSAELAEQYRRHGDWLETRLARRFAALVARARRLPRFWKLARLTGLGLILSGLSNRLA